LKEIT